MRSDLSAQRPYGALSLEGAGPHPIRTEEGLEQAETNKFSLNVKRMLDEFLQATQENLQEL